MKPERVYTMINQCHLMKKTMFFLRKVLTINLQKMLPMKNSLLEREDHQLK
jgi:hypothetical protein